MQRLSPVVVSAARDEQCQEEVQIQSLQNLLDKWGTWKLRLSIYQISLYKMAPCVFNGIIFLLGSSIKPRRSLLAALFNPCIDSDVQKRHRTVPTKQPWASSTPGRKTLLQQEIKKKNLNILLLFDQTDPAAGDFLIWSLVTTFGFKSQRMKGLDVLCAAQWQWSRAEGGEEECACQVDPDGD